ncbi:MAG: 6-bladed beta-propeller [Acidobacteria bacterium]|nr:6-bladed beta-propeller [Acidobacteriota bacterium]
MKRLLIVVSFALLNAALFAQQGAGRPPGPTATLPEIPYDAQVDVLKLPDGMYMGEPAGVALNSKGHIFVFHRPGRSNGPMKLNNQAQLWEFGPDGKFIREIGRELYGFGMAHQVRVDKDDNIWTVDEGADTVVKFSPEGRVLMNWGRRSETIHDWIELVKGESQVAAGPGAGGFANPTTTTFPAPRDEWFGNKEPTFGRVTDVAWDAAGNAFISDGYNNSRVVKIDKNGRYVKSFGSFGVEPGQMRMVHSVAVDGAGSVYVADRNNARVSVFDNDGKFLRAITGVGNPLTVCIPPGSTQVLFSADADSTFYKVELPSGKVVGKFVKWGQLPGEVRVPHGLACPSGTELWVGDLFNWRVQKLTLRAPARPSVSR